MNNICGDMLTRDERHTIHSERVSELMAGEISGVEFVKSLFQQVGFTELEAKRQWQDIRDLTPAPAIYSKKIGDIVFCPTNHGWKAGKIEKFYLHNTGVTVAFPSGLSLPFTLFQLRAVE